MRTRTIAILLSWIMMPALTQSASLADEATIMDGQSSVWRTLIGYRPPVIQAGEGALRPLKLQDYTWMAAEGVDAKVVPDSASPGPAADWAVGEFDDSDWSTGHCPAGPAWSGRKEVTMWSTGSAAQVDAIWARGRFIVRDRAQAGTVKLSVTFRGGVLVRLNGREIGRACLPKGDLNRDSLAEPYPVDAYVGSDNKPLLGEATEKSSDDEKARLAKRDRTLAVTVPGDALVEGVNVLAIEVRRSPYRDVCRSAPHDYHKKQYQSWPNPWPHCRLLDVQLSADGPGVQPNVGRPPGVQLWQPHPWQTVTGRDYGDACERIRPIRLVGVRNGVFTAQLAVSATQPIEGLRASASDLSGGGGRIASKCVRIRYPQIEADRFDGLLEAAPAKVEIREFRFARNAPGVRSAMQPVWVTVEVPPDAAPGQYAGKIAVEAVGLPPCEIPLSIQVLDWRLPDPKDLITHNNLWQSHETTAISYKVPLWSERHFELMGQSLALSAPLANKYCNIHLICGAFRCGNSQSMVRWINKGDGRFDYDFSVFDRYLNLYDKTLGKPTVLMVDVCLPIHSAGRPKDGTNPVKVIRLDSGTGQVVPMTQPAYDPPVGVTFWRPVLNEVRKRLENRGWWDVTVLGTASDSGPTPNEGATFKEIWPDRPWLFSGHPNVKTVAKGVPVRCLEWVWGAGQIWSPASAKPGQKYPRPWRRWPDTISLAFPRLGSGSCELYNFSPLSEYRLKIEKAIQSNMNGLGRVGLDFWPFTDDKGRRRQLCPDGGQFAFNAGVGWLLAMGPDGPVVTTRGQFFREGIQVAEAIAFLAKAVDNNALPAELAGRVEALLAERGAEMLAPDGHRKWQANETRLFALCAEVARQAPAASNNPRPK